MAQQDECDHFFEGTEKLLEVWFARSDGKEHGNTLKDIPSSEWAKLLQYVRCEIVKSSRHEHIDSYVLSESSMFVANYRFILKTCGQTTLLLAIEPLIELVERYCGFDSIQDIFYSHKNWMRPDLQHQPHDSFATEVSMLDNHFDDGAAYCLGKLNGDCWYLYTLNKFHDTVVVPDQTLEILMTGLDPDVMKVFTKEASGSAHAATTRSGIDKLWPNMHIDDYLFEPCGYSMNGILDNMYYMTIHVTPEKEFSYVSFETNVTQSCYMTLIQNVLNTFHPQKFLATIFANKLSVAAEACQNKSASYKFDGYRQDDLQYVHFKNYKLGYLSFHKAPS